MAHRAALYSVRVKEKWRDYQLLGDFDGNGGGWLGDVLGSFVASGFEQGSPDGEKVVRGVDAAVDPDDDLRVVMQHGQSGVAAELIDGQGVLTHRRTWTETEHVRCYSVFRLPPNLDYGFFATHINNGHSAKGLFERGLQERLARTHPDLKLEITPIVKGAALQEAIEEGRLDRVTLVRVERPGDIANSGTRRWVPGNQPGKLKLEITSFAETHLRPNLVQRFFRGDRTAMAQILEFQGLQFDEAQVQVTLEDGQRRTFNIEKPEAGHAMTVDLNQLEFDGDGEPSDASVFAGLKGAIDELEG